ncbi:hypothetical protein ABTN27_21245, partial [Acinetobacter baumannii]
MPVTVATYYRFADLSDYEQLREWVYGVAYRSKLVGTILLAPDGINSTIAG